MENLHCIERSVFVRSPLPSKTLISPLIKSTTASSASDERVQASREFDYSCRLCIPAG